jgi:SAM-dependent methyltransferase
MPLEPTQRIRSDYERQVQAQIAQYADVDDMHEGAPAAHFLGGRFLTNRLRDVFGTDSITEICAVALAAAVERTGIAEVVSLGSGYGAREIEVVKYVRDHGLVPFRIHCLELSPRLIERTRETARLEGLEQFIRADAVDLNQPLSMNQPVAACMAHHSLHHLVELELLFEQIVTWLPPEGCFVTVDMIGRNGHMRWPETLAIVREIWPYLPDRLKWDEMFQKLDRWFENWDCSIEGFEGVRAQDILPLLIRHGFRFERFFATGGLTEVFYDKRFGRNFNLDDALDVRFLEQVQTLEDRLIATGRIKPTCMFAVMRSPRSESCPTPAVCFAGVTPENSLRLVDQATLTPLPTSRDPCFINPYPAIPPPALFVVLCGRPVSFARGGDGQSLTRWGWADPEDDLTWSLGLEFALEFTVGEPVHAFDLRLIAYRPPAAEQRSLRLVLNGLEQDRIELSDQPTDRHLLRLRTPLTAGSPVLLEFALSRPRRPDLDGGDDKRPLGIALLSMAAL